MNRFWTSIQEMFSRAPAVVDDSDQPDLKDAFSQPPTKLEDAIRSAGGDLTKVVAWFESSRGKVYRFTVPGKSAVGAWRTLRVRFEETGHWPVILGPNFSVHCHSDQLEAEPGRSVDDIVGDAATVDIDAWQRDKARNPFEFDPEYRRPLAGEWPEPATVGPLAEFSAPLQVIIGKPRKQVWMGLLPVRAWWEACAVMRFGDWNEVPKPEIHVALHRRWNEQFGAELVSLKSDVLEFEVARPPTTREAALQLAELHYDYCPDNVDQGLGCIEALALTIIHGKIWYFWWD